MQRVTESLTSLAQAIENKQPIAFTEKGEWYFEGQGLRAIRWIFGTVDDGQDTISRVFHSYLDHLESHPLFLPHDPHKASHLKDWVRASRAVSGLLTSPNSALQWDFLRASLGLLYRVGKAFGGEGIEEPQEADLNALKGFLQDWKGKQIFYSTDSLDREDESVLQETAAHRLFCQLLLKREPFREHYFRWAIKNRHDPKIFIEYPATQKKMKLCLLSCRIAFFGPSLLKIQKEPNPEGTGFVKDLTLLFEGRPVSLLNPDTKYTFRGDYTLSIRQVFEIFDQKRAVAGNLELSPDGIINWNAVQLGYWDAIKGEYCRINLDREDWWEEIPIYEKLSMEDVARKFDVQLLKDDWVVVMVTSQEKHAIMAGGYHTYCIVTVPFPDHYRLYTFGKFPLTFPLELNEYRKLMFQPTDGGVASPDENVFYRHRKHYYHPVVARPEKVKPFMQSLRKDLLRVREKNFFFQFLDENCFKWIWKKMRKHFGEECVPPLDSKLFEALLREGEAAVVSSPLLALPAPWQKKILHEFSSVMGGNQKRMMRKKNGSIREVGVSNAPPWNGHPFFHPAVLIRRSDTR